MKSYILLNNKSKIFYHNQYIIYHLTKIYSIDTNKK